MSKQVMEDVLLLEKQILLLSKIYNESHGVFITGVTMSQGGYAIVTSVFILITGYLYTVFIMITKGNSL